MYPSNGRKKEESLSELSFTDGFLGAMEDTDQEEIGLPLIEEEILPSGKYQNIELEEASIDEPLSVLDKVIVPREEAWDYSTADFHGDYEKKVRAQNIGEIHTQTLEEKNYSLYGDSLLNDDDTLATLASLSDGSDSNDENVASDDAFDEVEDQEEDNYDDIESILASIGKANSSDSDDEGTELASGLRSSFRITQEDEELMQGFEIDTIISRAIDAKASDVHINPSRRIAFRINGSIEKVRDFDVIPGEITRRIQQKIVTNVADAIFLENWELDTSYTVREGKHRGRRVRVSVTKTFEEIAMVMRIISQDIPLPHELEIEDELLEWSELPNGLVTMNGPTGTGKSTTLASIVQNIQMKRSGVIVTVEKPVEYMYKDQGLAVIYQREVGRDTLSFAAALDSALRMDPDVILIGETRNSVEMNALLTAADTGHLALSTTHANSAAEAVNRIKRMFSGDERRQAMESLATVSRGFAAQVLCKTTDGKGRFAVREILTVDRAVSDFIMQGDNRGVRALQEERGITLDHNLVKAAQSGRCTVEEARSKSPNPRYFDQLMSERAKFF